MKSKLMFMKRALLLIATIGFSHAQQINPSVENQASVIVQYERQLIRQLVLINQNLLKNLEKLDHIDQKLQTLGEYSRKTQEISSRDEILLTNISKRLDAIDKRSGTQNEEREQLYVDSSKPAKAYYKTIGLDNLIARIPDCDKVVPPFGRESSREEIEMGGKLRSQCKAVKNKVDSLRSAAKGIAENPKLKMSLQERITLINNTYDAILKEINLIEGAFLSEKIEARERKKAQKRQEDLYNKKAN